MHRYNSYRKTSTCNNTYYKTDGYMKSYGNSSTVNGYKNIKNNI